MNFITPQSILKLQRVFKNSARMCLSTGNFGSIPGGGLGKLQRVKEEAYFVEEQQKQIQNLKDHPESHGEKCKDAVCFEDQKFSLGLEVGTSKVKDPREEEFFYHQNQESLTILKKQK